jgi:drug/metabolite transporter (DMT)-like permease
VIAVVLALLGAAAYGVSDFIGGLAGKRASPWAVATAGAVGGATISGTVALLHPGDPTLVDLAWGAAAGIGNGVGTTSLYRGLASGRMGVVAPISGVLAVVLPVAVAVVTGERPAALVWLGIAAALPAIWLVAREPTSGSVSTSGAARDGALAGLGFGALFACLGQVPDSAGFWPLVLNQGVAILVVATIASVVGAVWVPRGAAWRGVLAGLLGGCATVSFVIATQHGLLSVSAVLISLYPAVTILLAVWLLHEHLHRIQAWGLTLCGLAVLLVALG